MHSHALIILDLLTLKQVFARKPDHDFNFCFFV
jgi:hypothetical protein